MPVLFSNGKKILFIHVPKTGGMYVEKFLKSYGDLTGVVEDPTQDFDFPCTPQHFHAPMLHHLYSSDPWILTNPFDYVFMFVRNPLTRVVSEYSYQNRFNDELSNEDLSEWVEESLKKYTSNNFIFDNHIRPQNEFEAFDVEVFRYENGFTSLKKKLDSLLKKNGVLPYQKINQSGTSSSDLVLSKNTESAVREFYSEDFERYRYS